MAIFERLVGLETEYAVRVLTDGRAQPPTRFRVFQGIVAALRRRIPAVDAKHFKEGVFLATGGAVWYETERLSPDHGLIEGATPECRGPRQVVTYQRAQDRLLAEAAETVGARLIKNDRDGGDHVYGAQENYEAEFARGVALWGWRLGLLALLPLALAVWLVLPLMVVGLVAYLAVAGLLYLPLQLFVPDRRRLALFLFGDDLVEGRATGRPMPAWLEVVVRWLTNLATMPLAFGLLLLCRATAFRRQRRALLPFLISRAVLSGAGLVDRQDRFGLSDKAPAINTLVGLSGLLWDRPVFVMGHFFKAYCVESWFSWRGLRELFSARQRMQIGLGDSNMCELSEYLRVGTTLLVLDAIEAGELPLPPRLRRPLQALRQICGDPTLSVEVAASDGRRYSALELQRYYLDACRRYVDSQVDAPDEARELLQRWEETLEQLVEYKLTGTPPAGLVGGLDWVTKRVLLERAGGELAWEERKKIDIRYHELSPEGYYETLRSAGVVIESISADEVERACRIPPPGTPATTRGHYIREFSQGSDPVSANWRAVVIGRGPRAKVIRLRHYGQPQATPRPRNSVRLDGHQRADG